MPRRYVICIRRSDQPYGYYLTCDGFRCYTPERIAVFGSLGEAQAARDEAAARMTSFELIIERLPAGVRSVSRAVLSSVPV